MHTHGAVHDRSEKPSPAARRDRAADVRRLSVTLFLVAAYAVAETLAGFAANSLALIADAGHMLSDAAALGLSLFAVWFARRPADARRTYGYYRAEILAAVVNGATLVAVAVYIFGEAYDRFHDPPQVRGGLLTGVAVGGLLVNIAGLWILNPAKERSLNVRGAWLHVLTDALGSVGAIVAGVLVWGFGRTWADPAVSVLIGLLVVYSAWGLLRASVAVLMESAPRGIDVDHVRDAIRSVRGVEAVHDLHVWTVTSGLDSLSAHVVVTDPSHQWTTLKELRAAVRDRFGIGHVTIQVEPRGFDEAGTHR